MMNKILTESELEFIVSRVIKNAMEASEEEKSDFNDGKKLAYYEILDTIKNELEIREIETDKFGLNIVLEKLI